MKIIIFSADDFIGIFLFQKVLTLEHMFTIINLPNNGKILLRNVSKIADVTGATQEKCEQGTLLTLTSTEIKVIL